MDIRIRPDLTPSLVCREEVIRSNAQHPREPSGEYRWLAVEADARSVHRDNYPCTPSPSLPQQYAYRRGGRADHARRQFGRLFAERELSFLLPRNDRDKIVVTGSVRSRQNKRVRIFRLSFPGGYSRLSRRDGPQGPNFFNL